MNATVILIEMAVFAALFTVAVLASYGGDKKYSAAGVHNYPPDIQEEYFKTHERVDVSYQSKNVVLTKGLGVLLFTGFWSFVRCSLAQGRSGKASPWPLG